MYIGLEISSELNKYFTLCISFIFSPISSRKILSNTSRLFLYSDIYNFYEVNIKFLIKFSILFLLFIKKFFRLCGKIEANVSPKLPFFVTITAGTSPQRDNPCSLTCVVDGKSLNDFKQRCIVTLFFINIIIIYFLLP